uniref:Uncharacterized protein n=1 Tax=Rhizophora mucronata TaxID=61149 RepID=A0A2P2K1E5_RHIMU
MLRHEIQILKLVDEHNHTSNFMRKHFTSW